MGARTSAVTPQSFTTFGELVRYLRERAELSQRELALQVGYHYSYMSRIEKSERIPDSATLMARFVPALSLDHQPEWTAQLLKLAETSSSPAPSSAELRAPSAARVAPPTALPIFDLSASHIPIILTPLLGRDDEVMALGSLLNREDVRLVTVVGPPGVGKTRLVTHIAAQLAGSFADGAVFVDLTQIIAPKDFLPALAQALGVYETSEIPLMTHLVSALRQKNLLLVIDNFEHVIDAVPQALHLLGQAPQVKMLVTSREALGDSAEHEFMLTPLPLPQSMPDRTTEDALAFAAIQLFSRRAQAVQPDFQLTPENIDAVLEICRRLDGLPLAIELAAARVKMLAPQAMLTQFDRRLDWLARGARHSQAWHQTLRSAIEWSYNLLSENKQVLLRRLSVFSGGWTLESAEAVCADRQVTDSPATVRREDILDLLMQLVDRSLVVADRHEHETRFRFLETIHNFARGKLAESAEEVQVKDCHLAHFAGFAEEAEIHLYGPGQVGWATRVEQEHVNIRAALDWGLHENASVHDGLRLVAGVSRFWIRRSYFREGFEWLNSYLQRAADPSHDLIRTKILYRAGAMAVYMFEYATAYKLCQQSIELARRRDHKRYLAAALFYMSEVAVGLGQLGEARAALEESISLCWADYYPQLLNLSLTSLGLVLNMEGDYLGAQSTIQEGLAIAEQIDDTWGISYALHNLGAVHRNRSDYDKAIDYLERSLKVAIQIGDRRAEGVMLANLAILYSLKKDYATSERCAERSFAIFQTIGDQVQQPFPLRMMGYAAIQARNFARARILIRESLKGNRVLGHIPGQLACVAAFARCSLAEKDPKKAVALGALIETLTNVDGVKLMEPDLMALQEVLAQGRKKLGKAAYESAYEQGRTFKLDDELTKLLAE